MRRILLTLMTAGLISCNNSQDAVTEKQVDTTSGQDTLNTSITKPPAVDSIKFIREVINGINTETPTKKHFEFVCDEKMQVDYFFRGDEIVKIAVDFGTVGDVYAKEEYYYHAGELIFKYEFVEGGPACEGCSSTNEYRSYIRNNNVIRYLKNKAEEKCRTCSFSARSKPYRLLNVSTPEEIRKVFCNTDK